MPPAKMLPRPGGPPAEGGTGGALASAGRLGADDCPDTFPATAGAERSDVSTSVDKHEYTYFSAFCPCEWHLATPRPWQAQGVKQVRTWRSYHVHTRCVGEGWAWQTMCTIFRGCDRAAADAGEEGDVGNMDVQGTEQRVFYSAWLGRGGPSNDTSSMPSSSDGWSCQPREACVKHGFARSFSRTPCASSFSICA